MINLKVKKMKEDSFLKGAFIATFGIVICKILGILYAIPFYSIVGEQGGALYGYAYNIYSIFLGISNAGIPLAMSKIISEYHTLGYEKAKDRAATLGNTILTIVGIISFIILFAFADYFAYLIIGKTTGGNTVADVAFVIRIISFSILVVPIMSTFRGYFQGHKYILPTTVSQLLEQIVRVTIIIVGSFLASKIFHLSLKETVGIALFAATIGAIVSFLYLYIKKKRYKENFLSDIKVNEPKIGDKVIVKTLMMYAVPFIMIDLFRSLYTSVDTFMLVRVLVGNYSYTKDVAESVVSVFTTWGTKINMIIIALAPGIMTSLIPTITSSLAKKDYVDVRFKINQMLQVLVYLAIPMGAGLSFLAGPVWHVFYGSSTLGPQVYTYFAFVAVFTIFFTSSVTTVQLLKDYKIVFIALVSGLLTKVFLNVPLIHLFNKLGLAEYYGSTTATILGYLVCTILCLDYMRRKYHVNYKETFNKSLKVIFVTIVMVLSLILIRMVLPFDVHGRLANLAVLAIYSFIGASIYIIITHKMNLIEEIFGKKVIDRIKNIFSKTSKL